MSFVENVNLVATAINNGSVVIGDNGLTIISDNGSTITLDGSLTINGAFTTTLISTSTTSITLPALGTLSTLDGIETLSNKTLVTPILTGTPTVPTATSGTNNTQIANTGFVIGEKGGRRNYLINGNFDKWDYATSQTIVGYGSDNRWQNNNSGSTKIHSQVTCTDTERALFNAMYFSRTAVSSAFGADNFVAKLQTIENINLLAGKTVTLSFWAKADANKNIAIEFWQRFGTGGSPSTNIASIGSQLVSFTTTWQKKTITVTLPSIVGKTIGTDGAQTTSTGISFWFDAGSNFTQASNLGQQSGTFDIAQVKIEDGSVATNGWHPYDGEFGGEIAACSRYYEKGTGLILCSSGTSNFQGAISVVTFKSIKRASPTAIATQTGGTISAITLNNVYPDSMYIVPSSQASDGQYASYTWTASAEL
jgi:hypothetical protein